MPASHSLSMRSRFASIQAAATSAGASSSLEMRRIQSLIAGSEKATWSRNCAMAGARSPRLAEYAT